jgi:two-component system NarL family response regulator
MEREELSSFMTEEERPIRIMLAGEHALFSEAVRVGLESQTNFQVVSVVRNGLRSVAEADRTQPDVAIIHVRNSSRDGIRTAAMVRERVPTCHVLVLTDTEDHGALIEAVEAGAHGYLTNECMLSDLIDAVRAIYRGEMLVPPRMLGPLVTGLIRHRREKDEARRRLSRLTRREREVLALLARGISKAGIAETLVISPQTARTHIQNIISKLGVHTRLEAAMFVTQNEILDELTDDALARA